MSPWGWSPERTEGIWRYGSVWMRPLVAAAPWLTLLILILMFHVVGGTFTLGEGVVFELQPTEFKDGEITRHTAMIIPVSGETLVFFDDARYVLSDPASVASLGEHVSERVSRTRHKSLLVIADRRIPGGEIMKFSDVVRRSGVEKVLFAGKEAGETE